jgi:predicted DNA-binding protein
MTDKEKATRNENAKKYYHANKEKIQKKLKVKRDGVSEEVKLKNKNKAKAYYLKNKQKIKDAALEYYYANSTCERRKKGTIKKVTKKRTSKVKKTPQNVLEAQARKKANSMAPEFREYIRKIINDYEQEKN